MFILKKEATFTHPIVFYTPDDGGTQKKETFDAVFKIIPQSRINEIKESADKKQKEIDNGITDGDKEVPYTAATKKQLLDIPLLANTLVTEYLNVVAQQKTKN